MIDLAPLAGTYSHGTLRLVDLRDATIAMLDILSEHVASLSGADDPSGPLRTIYNRAQEIAVAAENIREDDPYAAEALCLLDVESFVGDISDGAYTWGMHPGDGADLGIWPAGMFN